MEEERGHEGGCLCGAVRFRVSGRGTDRCYCHCRSCRLASGAPVVAWATFPATCFRLTKGELSHYRSSKSVLRGFCSRCGTAITYRHEARPEGLDVTLASLDEAGSLGPEFHIWVSDKLDWFVPGDDLPRFPEWRESAS